MPPDEEMDSMYSESETPTPEKKSTDTETVDEELDQSKEIIASKDQLPKGVKEGDTITMKVVKGYGDEFGLQYVKSDTTKTTRKTSDEDFEELDTEEGM